MKTLKQRFSVWYNRRNERVGTLWEERFKSILVEGSENALVTMAAYIDLNPIRAGMVKDPKEYRYSGYGAAVAGDKKARKGLGMVMLSLEGGDVPAFAREGSGAATCRPASAEKLRRGETEASWGQIDHKYRKMLYELGEQVVGEKGEIKKRGFTRKEVEKVIKEGGKLPVSDALRCRVRPKVHG